MLLKYLAFVFAGFFAFASPLKAGEDISNEESAAIEQALTLGEAIYRYDQAAWHGTDAMLETIGNPQSRNIRGWIVNVVEAGHEVVFYRPEGEGFEAVWSGVYDGQRVGSEKVYEAGERPFTDVEAEMVRVQGAPFTVETDYSLCSEKLNTVVLPTGKEDGGFYVYLLAPQPALNQIPFGGHFRFEVVGGEVVGHRKFANSCLTLDKNTAANGRSLVALTVSHILDRTPTEVHVFSAYAAQMPIYVITIENERLWSVGIADDGPQIEMVER